MPNFAGMIKHVGMLNNTGKNVVVVFMSLPGDETNALIIDTDALPDNYNEAIRRIVESTEGQNAKDLGEVLGRRPDIVGDGTILQKLHHANRLQKVPVSLVSMTPRKGLRWPLIEVLKSMNDVSQTEPIGFDDLPPDEKAAYAANAQKFNVHANNRQSEHNTGRSEDAIGLIRQAELMENDAQNIRIRAYKLDPSLMPIRKLVPQQLTILPDSPILLETEEIHEELNVEGKKETPKSKKIVL